MNLFKAAWIFHITNIFSDETHQIKGSGPRNWLLLMLGVQKWELVWVLLHKLLCLLVLSCRVFWGHAGFPAYHGPKLGLRQTRTLPCLSGCHPSSVLGRTCTFKLQNLEGQPPDTTFE